MYVSSSLMDVQLRPGFVKQFFLFVSSSLAANVLLK